MMHSEQKGGKISAPRRSGAIRTLTAVLAAILVAYVLVYMPTPYVVFSPGTAEPTQKMIRVREADMEERGMLMLVTVRLTYANVLSYIAASFNRNADVYTRKQVFGDMNAKEYNEEQVYYMLTAQSDAVQAAYKKAAVPYQVAGEGALVMKISPGMPAEGVLEPGDRIQKVGGKTVSRMEDLLAELQGRKAGDQVEVRYLRGEETRTSVLTLADLPQTDASKEKRAGLGISAANILVVKPDDPNKEVKMTVEDIGGPSAGLMFSLEVYNQLTPGDLTKGYRIAGTGTITPDGKVGEIGGIQYKTVAVDREGAEIFFAPAKNYNTAVEKAKQIGSRMKIVKVDTMDDALQYLEKLPPKS